MKRILKMDVIKRTLIMWIFFQLLLWIVFGISAFFHQNAWIDVKEILSITPNFNETLLFILVSNLVICLLLILGNIFVRFGSVTPGLVILAMQMISIGWLAGANDFQFPFTSMMSANLNYLKIGLWETTAYILVCAVTLPKSLYISSTFPATKWAEIRKLHSIKLNKKETIIVLISLLCLIGAALVETFELVKR